MGSRIRKHLDHLTDATWVGEIAAEEVWKALATTDVLVMPVRWYENSPNVILEAQAVGVPVVGTRLGGVAELIEHEQNGLLFEPDNAASLAQQLQRLLDEPGLLARLRQQPLPFRYVDEEVDQIANLYTKLLEDE